jgi:hypothetical protein
LSGRGLGSPIGIAAGAERRLLAHGVEDRLGLFLAKEAAVVAVNVARADQYVSGDMTLQRIEKSACGLFGKSQQINNRFNPWALDGRGDGPWIPAVRADMMEQASEGSWGPCARGQSPRARRSSDAAPEASQ